MNAPPERATLRVVEDTAGTPLTEDEVKQKLDREKLLAAAFDAEPATYPERTARNGCTDLRRLILARRG